MYLSNVILSTYSGACRTTSEMSQFTDHSTFKDPLGIPSPKGETLCQGWCTIVQNFTLIGVTVAEIPVTGQIQRHIQRITADLISDTRRLLLKTADWQTIINPARAEVMRSVRFVCLSLCLCAGAAGECLSLCLCAGAAGELQSRFHWNLVSWLSWLIGKTD